MDKKDQVKKTARVARLLEFRDRAFARQVLERAGTNLTAAAWNAEYQPAIKSDPKEAPRNSSPSAFFSVRLGRTLHASSIAEAIFLALALYHPKVFAIRENHVLRPLAAFHPLAEHPLYRFMPWPSTTGTLQIADDLGMLSYHPQVLVGEKYEVVPWVGDIQVFLTDAQQRPRAIEWDVKSEAGKHANAWSGDWEECQSQGANSRARLREQVYRRYMNELQIPICQVAKDKVHPWVAANLMRLCARSSRPIVFPQTQVDDIGSALAQGVGSDVPPAEVIKQLVRKPDDAQPATEILYRWIWERRIRVDLSKPILIDHPLNPESLDVLDTFSHLFH